MKRQYGYSLIEVIVAFALLALALTLLLGTLTGAARQVRNADEISRATLHAQSLLVAQGVDTPLQPQHSNGSFDNGHYQWTLDISPYIDPHRAPQDPATPVGPRLLQLDLVVRWGDTPAQRLHWRTLRLAIVQDGHRS